MYLQHMYFKRCQFAVAVISKAFLKSKWASNWEWKAILARMQQQKSSFLLPYFLEKVNVPGLNSTIGYISAETHSPAKFAELIVKKVLSSLEKRRPD